MCQKGLHDLFFYLMLWKMFIVHCNGSYEKWPITCYEQQVNNEDRAAHYVSHHQLKNVARLDKGLQSFIFSGSLQTTLTMI